MKAEKEGRRGEEGAMKAEWKEKGTNSSGLEGKREGRKIGKRVRDR